MASESNPVGDMLALFVATFGGEVDTWQVRAYKRALAGVSRDVLLQAADLLINQAAAGRKFYPMPTAPDVKGACAKVIEVLRLKAFMAAAVGCTHPHYLEEITRDDGSTEMRRCSCWQRGREAMAQVGQQLSLPSHENQEQAS